ncbi:myc box-dependent-interacting protein 1-like [Saccoglossus kowalevskii]|uniref:Amphiphysin-like n=1 Tax=Saccoglossus kowalevskii TaxID=10224 RepID=A0ABM0GSZ3_SACKO|nr:PREDICTED: amphiphysin-like [Saccoglossus kowalevskii]
MAEGGKRSSFLGKSFTKHTTRAKERMLRSLGKADETKDQIFDEYVQNFNKQQAAAGKLQREVKQYIQCVKAMSAASKSFYETLRDVYEEDWEGYNQLNDLAETCELLWDDYQHRLSEQVHKPISIYQSQFQDMKGKVSKRGRKLVDYDSARHAVNACQSTKKKDEAKTMKAQESFTEAKKLYDDLNNELLEELPSLYDSRIPLYANTFQIAFSAESTFHGELSKAKNQLNDIMDQLAQAASNGSYNVGRPSRDSDSYDDSHSPSPKAPSTPEQKSSLARVYNVTIPNNENELDKHKTKVLSAPAATPEDDTEYKVPRATVENGDEGRPVGGAEGGAYEMVQIGAQLPSPAYHTASSDFQIDPATTTITVPPTTTTTTTTSTITTTEEYLPPGVLYKVRATHKYESMDTDELSFEKGEIIFVVPFDDPDDQDDGWLMGTRSSDGARGVFPENFTIKI